ncbi:alpha-scruin-like [Ruditapes philippinarum]|uniref:alpha-scruin-like n=1 Tax=Ruditapes philippinarum TaxID=129788 RepID=UPI00295AB23B|nr:alpha-scruin-like [Ruditapes philippinarum]
MNVARMSHSACVLDERIYVFGGLDGCGSALDSCEYYSPVMNRWVALWKMPVPIYAGSATTLGGKCYIAGGMTHNADDPTPRVRMTMICYDPRSRKWSVPGYLRMPLCHATLVNVQGRLLLCGGATYREEKARKRDLVSVASIDEYNILTNSWGFRTKMSSARQEVSAVTVGSKLYVIGGKNCEDEKIDQTVECYDTTFSTWKNCQFRLPTAVKNVKCVSCHNLK